MSTEVNQDKHPENAGRITKSDAYPEWAKKFRDSKDAAFYVLDIDYKITDQRDAAWSIRSYPCTGIGGFLTPTLPLSSYYPALLSRLKEGDTFLDIGCFIGHDLRQLVFDGAPSDALYGVDIVSHWDVGYDMFRDRDRFQAHFIEADILDGGDTNVELRALKGKVECLKKVVGLMDVRGQGKTGKTPVVMGIQVGSLPMHEAPFGDKVSDWHDEESFRRMWDEVGRETGTEGWSVECRWREWEDVGYLRKEVEYLGEKARMLQFVVTRAP
ncbi:hypothetical protein MMC25_000943 [Agyrium rufum]|nr:hypothetical protein [Agyrium rufum]